jgi:6-pyruvoyltetrahydropterin/6-carboxytetrahydropterin synthase
MAKLTLRRQIEFSAAHYLPDCGTRCESLHGHNYRVEAFVTGAGDETGMVKPFEDIKRDLLELVHARYDHRTINAVPPFDHLAPTTENLALVFLQDLRARDPRYTRVRVWETTSNYAEAEA